MRTLIFAYVGLLAIGNELSARRIRAQRKSWERIANEAFHPYWSRDLRRPVFSAPAREPFGQRHPWLAVFALVGLGLGVFALVLVLFQVTQ